MPDACQRCFSVTPQRKHDSQPPWNQFQSTAGAAPTLKKSRRVCKLPSFTTTLRSQSKEDMYLVRHNQQRSKGTKGAAHMSAIPGAFPQRHIFPYLSKTPHFPPFGEKVSLQHSLIPILQSANTACSSLPSHSTGTCSSRQWSPPNWRGSVTPCLAQ